MLWLSTTCDVAPQPCLHLPGAIWVHIPEGSLLPSIFSVQWDEIGCCLLLHPLGCLRGWAAGAYILKATQSADSVSKILRKKCANRDDKISRQKCVNHKSVILILFAFSDNLSAENSKLSADSWNRGNHLLGCMSSVSAHPKMTNTILEILQWKLEYIKSKNIRCIHHLLCG